MDKKFIEACDTEILHNIHKGDWELSNRDVRSLCLEIGWHITKLNNALLSRNIERIKEYACDVANYCEKTYTQAEILIPYKEKPKIEEIKFIKSTCSYPCESSDDGY